MFTLRKGFTLAEVLITLAVIGIVAAMTIPVLITKWQHKYYVTAIRKKLAEFTQVVNISILENGSQDRWDWNLSDNEFVSTYFAKYMKLSSCDDCWVAYAQKPFFFEQSAEAAPSSEPFGPPGSFSGDDIHFCLLDSTRYSEYCAAAMENCGTNPDYDDTGSQCEIFFNSEYYKSITAISETPDTTFTLNDGSTIGFTKRSSKNTAYFYVDINGAKGPNKYGADKFVLVVTNNRVSLFNGGETNLTAGEYGCSEEGNKMNCAAMLSKNNWEYPDNYPKL